MWATGPTRATSTPTQPTKNLSPTALLRINKQEEKRQQGVQDYEGERPTRSHGLQKDHLPQGEEKEEIAVTL